MIEKSEELKDYINNYFWNKTPDDVRIMIDKYPGLIRMHKYCSCYIDINGKSKYVSISGIDFPAMEGFSPSEFVKGDKKAIKLIQEESELEKNLTSTKNRIRCTLSHLRSYKKIKDEFPEAYKYIVEELDGKPIHETNKDLCTDIEKLRAELNS